jgi:hypothetical protein
MDYHVYAERGRRRPIVSAEQIAATLEAIAVLQTHVDGSAAAGRWLELSDTAKDIRVSAWQRLKAEVRAALTGEATS